MYQDQAPDNDPTTWTPLVLTLFVLTTFLTWTIYVGTSLARLWYHSGQLHRKFPKYDIQPHYIRERLALEADVARRTSQRLLPSRGWTGDATTMSFSRVQHMSNADLRQRVFEGRRISRMPAFEQDDGGDGSGFPEMPVGMSAEVYNERYFPGRCEDHRELGLGRMDGGDWVTYCDDEQMEARKRIVEEKKGECVDVRVGREAEEACGELWKEVAKFLVEKYPWRFWERREDGVVRLWDEDRGEIYELEGPYGSRTLDRLARLVREDFCVFKKSPFSGQFTLLAGATCFPSGWRFKARVGRSVDSQQEAVLPWEKLPEILAYVDEHGDRTAYKRHVSFIQTGNPHETDVVKRYLIQEGNPHETDVVKKYFIQEGKDFFAGNISFLQPETLHARVERQMFRRLPVSGAIVLTTRVQIEPLVRMGERQLRHLAKDIRRWPAHVARLKGRDIWSRAVLGYIERFPMAHDDETVVGAGELTEEEGSGWGG